MNKTPIYLISLAILISACKKKDDNADALINLNKNLVLYYPFNGDAIDAGPNHINGTLKNGPVFTEDHSGNANNAILFDGGDDFVQANSSSILDNLVRPFTFSTWIRIDGWYLTGNQWASVLCKSGLSFNAVQYRLALKKDNNSFWLSPLSCSDVSDGYAPSQNTWFHIAVVENINDIRIYINGVLKNTYPCADPIIKNNYPLLIGSDPAGDQEYFNGAMDEFRIFNKALSSEEVLLLL